MMMMMIVLQRNEANFGREKLDGARKVPIFVPATSAALSLICFVLFLLLHLRLLGEKSEQVS